MGEEDKSPFMTKGRMKTADKGNLETPVCEGNLHKELARVCLLGDASCSQA